MWHHLVLPLSGNTATNCSKFSILAITYFLQIYWNIDEKLAFFPFNSCNMGFKGADFPCVSVILYALSAVYFAGVMVRLMLTLTPCVCVLAAIGFSRTFNIYLKDPSRAYGEEKTIEDSQKDEKLYDKVRGAFIALLGVWFRLS